MSMVMTNPDAAQLSLDLTEEEQNELETCERIIERNLKAFMETGGALMTISEKRLYRATHSTFDAYCRDKWNISRQYAYQLMQAADIAEEVSAIVDIPAPSNPAQVRPLAKLETTAERQEAWQEAVETAPEGKVTAAHVQAVVQKRTEPEKPAEKLSSEVRPETSHLLKPVSAAPEPPHEEEEIVTLDDATDGATAQEPAKPAQIIPKNIQEAPATPPAPARPAESAPAPSGMMTVLIPQDEDDWLWEQNLTAATAIAKLREVMEQLELANAALQRPQLTLIAERALTKMVAYINEGRKDPVDAAGWLETVLVTRADAMGVLAIKEAEDTDDE